MKEYKYKINGNPYNVIIGDIDGNIAHVEVNGTTYEVEMSKKEKAPTRPVVRPAVAKPAAPAATAAPVAAPSNAKGGVKSPLPGTVLHVKVAVGDMVKSGQPIIILESMKMENIINSDRDGKVVQILVKEGSPVNEGNDLVIIE